MAKSSLDTVKLTIKGCNECPKMQSARYYTEDSFETVFEWNCGATEECERIAIVEWNDPTPPIPWWCPLRSAT